ncbi:cardiolipin synthase [Thermovibrio guaymasensis]|uniref:CDP-diacylglycerol--glycerol-3-phosphate 3-phosphatidyltransferase n=1 Tax=Thermovibrio guaymasensis TaxID=240167 RepID=A0A420W6E5_9BACT|nr:CDP-diacylglycerol--glycerol-3-phosphate 3-phosphatidyltransferase [Thermovibrio guaymasensis]RKQ61614.1 cardiolipin synthase [Thermovibrio guaymasensis]
MLSVPNLITLVRVFLIPVFIMASFYHNFKLAFAVFVMAALSDALDGFLARRLNQITKLGVILDPVADKALIDSGFFLLSYFDRAIPVWLSITVISRDVLLLFGGWLLSAFGRLDRIRPNFLGKLTAFFQFFTLFLVLFNLNFKFIPRYIFEVLFVLTGFFTVVSAVIYTFRGIRELSSE